MPDTSSQTSSSDDLVVRLITIARKIMPRLFSVISLSAILTVVGFFIVQSYLSGVTGIFTYNISLTQYLAAGLSLLVLFSLIFILPCLLTVLVLHAVLLILRLIGKFLVWLAPQQTKRIADFGRGFLQISKPILQKLYPAFRTIWVAYQVAYLGVIFLVTVFFALIYGRFYYDDMPRWLGGGMPANVILLFDEPQPSSVRWSFPISAASPYRSDPVQLLIEVNDGILVRDLVTNIPMIVKSDVLVGIIDAQLAATVAPPTPRATPTVAQTAFPHRKSVEFIWKYIQNEWDYRLEVPIFSE